MTKTTIEASSDIETPAKADVPARESTPWVEGALGLLRSDLAIDAANDSFLNWLGELPAAVNGRSFLEMIHQKIPSWGPRLAEAFLASHSFQELQLPIESGAGKLWFHIDLARNSAGWFVRVNSVLPSLDEMGDDAMRQSMGSEAASRNLYIRLMRAEAQLDNLVHRWPGVIFSQRADLSFFFVSPRIEELTGVSVEEWRSPLKRFWQVVHEADAEEVQKQLKRSLKEEKGITTTYRIRNVKTGRVAYIMEHRKAVKSPNGLLLGYEGLWLDVTRQTIAEKRLSSAAWKETLAVLTMGLAHDFSNIMAGILALSEEFQSQIEKDHPFREGLNLIKRNSLQASQLVHRILNLHHGKPGEKNYQDLNELTGDMADLARKVVPRSIKCETVLFSEPLPIYVDMVEFRQVFINLTLNAADAMPQGGHLQFATSRATEAPKLEFIQGSFPRLPAVCLAVADSGCGIPQQHLASIFDPFFTTKSANKGSGLGLYNTRLFVEKHQGAVSVESHVGKGTTFKIWLPESDFTESETESAQTIPRRTVLVVAPPGQNLDYTVDLLRRSGYGVVTATSEQAAIQTLSAGEYHYAGVLVQVTAGFFVPEALFESVRRSTEKPQLILHVVGCNQDEIQSRWLNEADLILSQDVATDEWLTQVNGIWDDKDRPEI